MTNLYSDDEMIEEIREEIEELGGAVRFVPGDNIHGKGGGIQLYIEPALLDQARLVVNDIREKYRVRREEVRANNPFMGVQELLDIMK